MEPTLEAKQFECLAGLISEIDRNLTMQQKNDQFQELQQHLGRLVWEQGKLENEIRAAEDQLHDMCDAYYGHEFDTEEGGLCLTCGCPDPHDQELMYDVYREAH